MKNLKTFALIALSLLGFAACQQEEINHNDDQKTHTVTFVAGAPETKTTVSIEGNTAKFAWTENDVNRFTVYENGTAATKTTGVLGEDGKMTLSATFDGTTPEGDNTYVATLNSSNGGQIMSAEAYDEDADILVSKAVSAFDGNNGVQLQFKREVAIAKMTLKGLDAGEVVNMITVSSTADIAGSYDVEGWASPAKSLEISSASYMGETDGYSIVASDAGEAVVWFTCIPQDAATLTIEVEAADGDTYTKEFRKPITLTRGDVKGFGVAMEKDVVAKPWVAVELADIDETMPLVITMATTDKTYALSLTDTDGNALGASKSPKAIEVSVVDGKLSDEPSSDILWNIANNNGNLTIYPNGVTDKWLYTTDSNSGVRLGTNTSNGYVWSIDAESGYLKANASSTSTKIRYLGVYVTGPDWRAYTNTTGNTAGQTLCFYSNATSIAEDPTVPKLSVTPTSKTWESDETDAAVFTVTTNAEGVKDWSVSPTTLEWATIDIDKDAGKITVTPTGANTEETAHKATLTVTHAAGTLSEPITLKQKSSSQNESYEVSGTLASWNFTSSSYPANQTNYANNGSEDLTTGTFYLNGTGSTWNSSKGYAFTAVTDITITVTATKALKKGSKITFSMDTYYNKASNAPMKGFNLTAAEGDATASTTGLSVTSFSLSTSSATKSVDYTLQNDVSAGSTVKLILTQTDMAGSGQGYIDNIKAKYTAE